MQDELPSCKQTLPPAQQIELRTLCGILSESVGTVHCPEGRQCLLRQFFQIYCPHTLLLRGCVYFSSVEVLFKPIQLPFDETTLATIGLVPSSDFYCIILFS